MARVQDRLFTADTLFNLANFVITPYLAYRLAHRVLQELDPERIPIYTAPRPPSTQDLAKLPYPPDCLPGARDVDTPYGNIRVYEWGPEDGRKVLFVHGISTPCIAFAGLAKRLVEQHGCRVMLFDLFGRGYSDAPNPETYRQNIQLWTSQILLVLSSSDLNWMEGFALVGYSLGGGIGAAFTSYFPKLVKSLVLIAPAGLLRPNQVHWTSKLIYGGMMPDSVVTWLVRKRLSGGQPEKTEGEKPTTTPGQTAAAETPEHPAHMPNSTAALFADRPGISVAKAVGWQVDAHPGFVPAFVSSIQHSPISGQHARWQLIGSRCAAQRAGSGATGQSDGRLREGKVLILQGATDNVIVTKEIVEDASEALGKENVRIEVLEGGHDVPIVNAEGCAQTIADFWSQPLSSAP